MEETIICKLCLEPIYNFICINCLQKSISRWLSSVRPKLTDKLKTFHSSLLEKFSSDQTKEFCIKCKNIINTVVCPYCYVKEIFWWIFDEDVGLSKELNKFFNFDFMGVGYLKNIETRNLAPIITYKTSKPDLNICENCDQVSDYLKKVNGVWLCESCRDSEPSD